MKEASYTEILILKNRVRNNIYEEASDKISEYMGERDNILLDKYAKDMDEFNISLSTYRDTTKAKKDIMVALKDSSTIEKEVEKFLDARYKVRVKEAAIGGVAGVGAGALGVVGLQYAGYVAAGVALGPVAAVGACGIVGARIAVNYMDSTIYIDGQVYSAKNYLQAIDNNIKSAVEKQYVSIDSSLVNGINDARKKRNEEKERKLEEEKKALERREKAVAQRELQQPTPTQSTSHQDNIKAQREEKNKEAFMKKLQEANKDNSILELNSTKKLMHELNHNNFADKVGNLNDSKIALQKDLEDNYICSILRDVPNDPIYASDGHLYSKERLMQNWNMGNKTSPMTREMLENPSKTKVAISVKNKIASSLEDIKNYDKLINWMNSNQSILTSNQSILNTSQSSTSMSR